MSGHRICLLALVAGMTFLLPVGAAQERPAAKSDDEELFRAWLEGEVVYVICPEEKERVVALETGEQRTEFIDWFWLRRDPDLSTEKNEFRDEHYRRLEFVDRKYSTPARPGWKTDRGWIYILYGAPDSVESFPGKEGRRPIYPFERWNYREIRAVGSGVTLEFVDFDDSGDYRLTIDPGRSGRQSGRRLERHPGLLERMGIVEREVTLCAPIPESRRN